MARTPADIDNEIKSIDAEIQSITADLLRDDEPEQEPVQVAGVIKGVDDTANALKQLFKPSTKPPVTDEVLSDTVGNFVKQEYDLPQEISKAKQNVFKPKGEESIDVAIPGLDRSIQSNSDTSNLRRALATAASDTRAFFRSEDVNQSAYNILQIAKRVGLPSGKKGDEVKNIEQVQTEFKTFLANQDYDHRVGYFDDPTVGPVNVEDLGLVSKNYVQNIGNKRLSTSFDTIGDENNINLSFSVDGDMYQTATTGRALEPENMAVLKEVFDTVINYAKANDPKTISFSGSTNVLSQFYKKVGPKLAKKLGGEFKDDNFGFIIDLPKNSGAGIAVGMGGLFAASDAESAIDPTFLDQEINGLLPAVEEKKPRDTSQDVAILGGKFVKQIGKREKVEQKLSKGYEDLFEESLPEGEDLITRHVYTADVKNKKLKTEFRRFTDPRDEEDITWMDFDVNGNNLQTSMEGRKADKDVTDVLSTVMDALIDYTERNQPNRIRFTPATPRLEKFYQKIIPRLAKQLGGEATVVPPVHSRVSQYTINFPARVPNSAGGRKAIGTLIVGGGAALTPEEEAQAQELAVPFDLPEKSDEEIAQEEEVEAIINSTDDVESLDEGEIDRRIDLILQGFSGEESQPEIKEETSVLEQIGQKARELESGVIGAPQRIVGEAITAFTDPFKESDLGMSPAYIEHLRTRGVFPPAGDLSDKFLDPFKYPIPTVTELVARGGATTADVLLRGLKGFFFGAFPATVKQTAVELGASQSDADQLEQGAKAFAESAPGSLGVSIGSLTAMSEAAKIAKGVPLGPQVLGRRLTKGGGLIGDNFNTTIADDVADQATSAKINDDITVVEKQLDLPLSEPPATIPLTKPTVPGLDGYVAPKPEEEIYDLLRIHAGIARKEESSFTRNTTTFAEQEELNKRLGLTHEELQQRKVGTAFNAEETRNAVDKVDEAADDVFRLAGEYKDTGDEATYDALRIAVRNFNLERNQLLGVKAELGRGLGTLRDKKSGSKVKQLEEFSDATGLTEKEMVDFIVRLDSPGKVANFMSNVRDKAKKLGDNAYLLWLNSLLSGPQTHAANIIGSGLNAAWEVPKGILTAGISKVTGSGVTFAETLHRGYGFVQGAREGVKLMPQAYRTGKPVRLGQKLDYEFDDTPAWSVATKALQAEDELMKSILYRSELNAMAMREAYAKGLRGTELSTEVARLKNNPSLDMIKDAKSAAEKGTFTNELGKLGQAAVDFRNKHFMFRVITPFMKTPINIVNSAAKKTPLSLLYRDTWRNLRGLNGAAKRDEELANLALGSMTSIAVASHAAEGNITGGGPKDPKRRSLMYANGWQPYSVKVGGKWYSYSRLEPLGMMMGIVADFTELRDNMDDAEAEDIGLMVALSIAKNVTSKTWMQGPAELLNAIDDPERNGARWSARLAGTLVPTGIAQIARTMDPVLREVRTKLDGIKNRIPGEKEKLRPRLDVFGEPITSEQLPHGLSALSPVWVKTSEEHPVAKELLRLDKGIGKVRNSIQGVKLNDDEYFQLRQLTGQAIEKTLLLTMQSEGYQELTDDLKRRTIHDNMRKARDFARDQFLEDPNNEGVQLKIIGHKLKNKFIKRQLKKAK